MPQQDKPSIYPLLGIIALTLVMLGMLVTTPPRNTEPIRLPSIEYRTVEMPMGYAGPMSTSINDAADACPGEEIVRFERPEGLPEYEPDMWTCAKYVEAL